MSPGDAGPRAARAAARLFRRRRSVGRVLGAADAMLERKPGALRRLRGDLAALLRMLWSWLKGRYPNVPRRTLLSSLAALVYFVNPLDLVPDVLPLLGLADDAVVLSWVLAQVKRDLDAFKAWETDRGGAIEVSGEVVPPRSLPPD
ncbi:MAG: YkvA family protein [Acidobacteriota bacterium]